MEESQLFARKNTLTVYEAAQLLTRSQIASQAAIFAIVNAIDTKQLAAAVKRWPKYDASAAVHCPQGNINRMETTVQRSDFVAWLQTRGLAVALQGVANLDNAQTRHTGEQNTATAPVESRVDDTMTSGASARRQNVWSAALGQVESARINARADIGAKITHRLTETSPHELAEVIAKATKSAADAKNYQSVWTALSQLAASGNPPSPLLGQAGREAVKYEANNRVKLFTKSALRRMMSRAAAKFAK